MCFVGLFKIRSHFGENFIVGDSYIDGETKIFTYIIPDIRGTCQTVRKTVSDTTIIQITFINTDLLDFYCQRTQEIDEFFTALRVESMIRRNNSKRRTLAQCTGYRFSGLYMIDFFCGNRFGKILTLRNLFIVAFLSGIWHGAGWGFVIWGALHGVAMVIHRIYLYFDISLRYANSKIYKIFCWFITFNFLNITWIFFRSQNLDGALNLLKGMFGVVWIELPQKLRFPLILEQIGGRNDTIIYLIIALIITLIRKNSIEMLNSFKPNLKNAIFAGLLLYIALITLSITPYVEFIYFNF